MSAHARPCPPAGACTNLAPMFRRTDLVLTPTGLRFRGRRYPCTIGRSGLVEARKKREGDGATPCGAHRITGCLYRPDRMVKPVPWATPIGPSDLWSDDPADPAYNHLVRVPHGFSHETLHRADPLYDLVLTTDWNWPRAEPGRGSAIFLHRWRRPGAPTAGCVALRPGDLLRIVRQIRPGCRLVVRIGGVPMGTGGQVADTKG